MHFIIAREREMIKCHNPAQHSHGNSITMKSSCWCKGKMLSSLMQNTMLMDGQVGPEERTQVPRADRSVFKSQLHHL